MGKEGKQEKGREGKGREEIWGKEARWMLMWLSLVSIQLVGSED